MAQLSRITVRSIALHHAGLTIRTDFECLSAPTEIVVGCGFLKIHRVSHSETKSTRHRPGAFGHHQRAALHLVVRHHMVNAIAHPAVTP